MQLIIARVSLPHVTEVLIMIGIYIGLALFAVCSHPAEKPGDMKNVCVVNDVFVILIGLFGIVAAWFCVTHWVVGLCLRGCGLVGLCPRAPDQ